MQEFCSLKIKLPDKGGIFQTTLDNWEYSPSNHKPLPRLCVVPAEDKPKVANRKALKRSHVQAHSGSWLNSVPYRWTEVLIPCWLSLRLHEFLLTFSMWPLQPWELLPLSHARPHLLLLSDSSWRNFSAFKGSCD